MSLQTNDGTSHYIKFAIVNQKLFCKIENLPESALDIKRVK